MNEPVVLLIVIITSYVFDVLPQPNQQPKTTPNSIGGCVYFAWNKMHIVLIKGD